MLLIPQESTHVMPKKNPPMTDRAIKASTKPEISVGGCNNLKLRTDSSGRRWVLTVPTCRACGRRHNFGLGSYPEVSAKEARERGNEIHRDNRAGICRKEQKAVIRQQQREEAAKRMTYREACERFIPDLQAKSKNAKNRQQWYSTNEQYCYPIVGSKNIGEITVKDVCAVFDKDDFWHEKHETARRLRNRMERIIGAAIVRLDLNMRNPAEWKNNLDQIYTLSNKKGHFPSTPYSEAPALYNHLLAQGTVTHKLLAVQLLQAKRPTEIRISKWSELDLAKAELRIDVDRMLKTKSKRQYWREPLSTQTLAIINSIERTTDYIFGNPETGEPYTGDWALTKLKETRFEGSVHGFRSTFRTYMQEQTAVDSALLEQILSHSAGGVVDSYARGEAVERRREVQQSWGDFLGSVE